MDRKKILIVDDEERVIKVIKLLLRHENLDIEQASTGEEALEMVSGAAYDLIILDLMLPGVSGNDVLRKLRSDPANEALPIIILSGKSDDNDMLETLRDGAIYYLTKPFEPTELKETLEVILGISYA